MLELALLTTHFDLPTNRLYGLRDSLLARGTKIVDLVSGNVSEQGITFPSSILEKALVSGVRKTKFYRPHPLGRPEARKAISAYYAEAGLKIPSEQILMTPGTSVSYWYAFKTLTNPGDEILVPSPSYPLFDSIAQLAGVHLVPYRLREGQRWEIDADSLRSALSSRTRAIILISPHNPTGAVASEREVRLLADIAGGRNLAIISDEVFSPFLFTQNSLPRPAGHSAPLVLTLNGLSKMLALPGFKIGWMAVTGEPAVVAKTMKTLDHISDTFLPVAEPAQAALPQLMSQSRTFQARYAAEIRRRMEIATGLLSAEPQATFAVPEGGFYLTIKLEKDRLQEEEVACRLLEKHRALVHPGYFYDMEGEHLVLSFVSRPAVLKNALEKIIEEIR